jgi:hypothetical protein
VAGFDLFGLKKGSSPESPEPAPAPSKDLPAKVWKGLAAADAVVLLACLSLLAVRVRGHLSAPPLPPPKPAVVKKAEPKAPEAKPEALKPEPAEAKKPEPKPEAKKPEPKAEAKKPEPKPAPKEAEKKAPLGSPAIHAAPTPKRDPAPVGAPPPPSFAPKKAATRPVPFTYEEAGAKEVYLVGPFLVRSGGRKAMFKDSRGAWRTTVYLNIGQTYKYRFEVVGENGKKQTPARSVEVLEAD